MEECFSRTKRLFGEEGMRRLARSRVAIFGLGGVGGAVLEALARSGIGALDLIDHDRISESNLNRQILATRDTIGKLKVDAAAERVASIWPDCQVRCYPCFYLPETAGSFPFAEFDYVVDAIDTVTAKLSLIREAQSAGIPILCSLGTGNKMDPSALRIGDLFETREDPLARVMRRECRDRGIRGVTVLWSTEKPLPAEEADPAELAASGRRSIPGSAAFVPPAAGFLIASRVVSDLLSRNN